MAYYTERSIKHWSVRCTNNRCASNQSTDPEGSRSQSSHIAFWRHFTAKQDMGKCWISFDSTLTRACKPMTRSNLIVLVTLTWLDHVMTRPWLEKILYDSDSKGLWPWIDKDDSGTSPAHIHILATSFHKGHTVQSVSQTCEKNSCKIQSPASE